VNSVLSKALRIIVTALDRLKVRHALIGGYALAFHNVVRATEDLGFLLDRSISEISNLAEQLTAEGYPAVPRKGSHGDPVAGVVVVEIRTDDGMTVCDLIFPSTPWQAKAVRDAVAFEVEGLVVHVVQALDLFLLKLNAGGPQDLLDAADLFRMQSRPDRIAWKSAASKLRMADEYKRCLKFLKGAELGSNPERADRLG
jgi:hypothetical protein